MNNKLVLSSITDILKDLKKGNLVVIVDDENRENEGDLVFVAEKVDSEKINFMAKHARGLICLALDEERVKKLKLELMANENASRNKTAFTVSIEAKEGVTTGISAMDRARTIKAAVSPNFKTGDIVSPGHIFPLVAKNGGVLVRAGHTEAAVDLARLSGLNPSGVICEIMNDDGTMARFQDLVIFCKRHNLKIGTIKDLIEYRMKTEKFVKCVHKDKIKTIFGEFNLFIYKSKIDFTQHIVLTKGQIKSENVTTVRMHTFNMYTDFLSMYSRNNSQLNNSMEYISQNNGVIVIIRNPKKELDIKKKSEKLNEQILKEYGIGAQILLDIGVKNICLLSNTKKNIVGIEGFGLKIHDIKPITESANEK